MKQFLAVIVIGILILSGAAAQSMEGRTMFVTAKTVELKASAGFFANARGILEYGDQVTVLQEDGKWVEVRPAKRPSLTGWIASANLTSKRIITAGSGTSASASELALAGKGFSEAVEQSYRQDNAVNYAEIDAMESQGVPKEDLYGFLREGRLNLGDQ